jgi:CheY-like chemotaxis protein
MDTSNYTILLVEDDPDEVFLMQRAFQKANLTTPLCVVRDGQEAIDYLNRQGEYADSTRYPEPTLMLLDLKMPRKNGFEVLEWIRQQPGLRRLIVVVLTSSNQIADIDRAYDLGTNSYMVKPGDFETMINLVKTFDAYWMLLNQSPDLQPNAEPSPLHLVSQNQPETLEPWTNN